MKNVQEINWIRRIKRFGSSGDADLLVRSYYDEIYVFVARQIRDREYAYDLTQEIFISMLRSIASYQENGLPSGHGSIGSPRTRSLISDEKS